MIKLNEAGDTLWTNQISPDLFHDPFVFENADGTFTLISSYLDNYSCGQTFLGGIWGLPQIITANINSFGELLSYSSTQQISLRHLIPGIYVAMLKSENEILMRANFTKL